MPVKRSVVSSKDSQVSFQRNFQKIDPSKIELFNQEADEICGGLTHWINLIFVEINRDGA